MSKWKSENQASVFYFLTVPLFKESPFYTIITKAFIVSDVSERRKERKEVQEVIGLRLTRVRFEKSKIGKDFWMEVLEAQGGAKFWNELC